MHIMRLLDSSLVICVACFRVYCALVRDMCVMLISVEQTVMLSLLLMVNRAGSEQILLLGVLPTCLNTIQQEMEIERNIYIYSGQCIIQI